MVYEYSRKVKFKFKNAEFSIKNLYLSPLIA